MKNEITITWYGRCCFLVKLGNTKALFDPYDTFFGIDIGFIESDILLSSSTWHDHGHIGASPKSCIYSYPGTYEHSGITITGIESKEDRGTPNIIFNIQYQYFSITNFADFGPTQEDYFDATSSDNEKSILQTTNIAFVRPMIERDKVDTINIHNENFLKYCSPHIIIPEHYHPRDFMQQHIPEALRPKFEPANVMVDELSEAIGYPVEEIENYKTSFDSDIVNKKILCRFMRVHPQVKYIGSMVA
ncbi:MBL fold metallo-hydrolase [Candidatus Woesebacteria bacterium]|nr:MBL fold metallo-hydrolase [Candidatus Woesebacteria bacterium]